MTLVDGTLSIRGDVAVIGFERRLAHPVDVVWAALTEPDQLAAWLGEGNVEPREGGQVSIRTGAGDRAEQQRLIAGRVLTWEPPHVFEHEWTQPGVEVSVVRYELEPAGSETILRFTHRRNVTGIAMGGRAGWHAYLDRFAAYLDGLTPPEWAQRRTEVQDAYGEAPLTGLRARRTEGSEV